LDVVNKDAENDNEEVVNKKEGLVSNNNNNDVTNDVALEQANNNTNKEDEDNTNDEENDEPTFSFSNFRVPEITPALTVSSQSKTTDDAADIATENVSAAEEENEKEEDTNNNENDDNKGNDALAFSFSNFHSTVKSQTTAATTGTNNDVTSTTETIEEEKENGTNKIEKDDNKDSDDNDKPAGFSFSNFHSMVKSQTAATTGTNNDNDTTAVADATNEDNSATPEGVIEQQNNNNDNDDDDKKVSSTFSFSNFRVSSTNATAMLESMVSSSSKTITEITTNNNATKNTVDDVEIPQQNSSEKAKSNDDESSFSFSNFRVPNTTTAILQSVIPKTSTNQQLEARTQEEEMVVQESQQQQSVPINDDRTTPILDENILSKAGEQEQENNSFSNGPVTTSSSMKMPADNADQTVKQQQVNETDERRLSDGAPNTVLNFKEDFEINKQEKRVLSEDHNENQKDTQKEKSEKMVPASVLDKFTDQMQRLEEHYTNEQLELERKHRVEMEKAREQLSKVQSRYREQLSEKKSEWQTIMQKKEGMELKIDMLQRELKGTQDLLQERDSALSTTHTSHDMDKQELREQMKEIQENAGSAQADVYQVQSQLKAKESELEQANEAYAALKTRVKVVATELKERRVESRTLGLSNTELTEDKERLELQVSNFTSQLDDRNRSNDETIIELDQLREKVKTLEEELKEAEGKVQQRGAVGDQALSAYKKKAQNSLAVGNARTAAAVQAREEAELEACAARQTADEAIKRAQDAESKSQLKLDEAKGYVTDMEQKVATFEAKASNDTDQIASLSSQLEQARDYVQSSQTARESLAVEVSSHKEAYEQERAKTTVILSENADLQQRANNLYDEVETLREELRKSAAAAFMAQTSDDGGFDSLGNNSQTRNTLMADNQKSESEATILMLQQELKDGNLAIKELKETLRSQLETGSKSDQRSTTTDNETTKTPQSKNASSNNSSPIQNSSSSLQQQQQQQQETTKTNDSTPLFFAMEKQAELTQAHDEINRLATMLGELESEKMEAYELLQEMNSHKELAEARLRRFEKLGGLSSTHSNNNQASSNHQQQQQQQQQQQHQHQQHQQQPLSRRNRIKDRFLTLQAASRCDTASYASYGSWDSNSADESDHHRTSTMATAAADYNTRHNNNNGSFDQLEQQPAPDLSSQTEAVLEAQVNLEYLKNVMLSYLKAKTYNERKRLIPAVSAVLCLTDEESRAAMKSVEESGSVESMGLSLFENLGNRAGLKLI